MTLRLILTRHAKSSWDDPRLADHDRPLAERGRRASALIGRWLSDNGFLPDEVLCSDSVRTRETWERIAACLPNPPEARLLPALYLAPPAAMLRVLQAATGQVVMMLGHNPGIGVFAGRIVRNPPKHPKFTRYPTAATLVADFERESWAEVGFTQGLTRAFVVPRDLE